ncbi:MAG: lipid-binding protein [Bacteroidetes bacterium]|nr:MAG: lipid-binding protein [Bacteroidota bacterium]
MNVFILKLLTMLLLGVYAPGRQSPAEDWVLKNEVDGIRTYTRATNTSFKELKMVTELDASLSSMVAVLGDKDALKYWVYNCSDSYFLHKVSATETYHYQQTDMPWPLEKRDVVIHAHLTQDPVTKVVVITATGIQDYYPLKEGVIRVPELRGKWVIKPIGPNRVYVENYIFTNPGGDLPAWLVNLAITEGPTRSIQNLKKRLPGYAGAQLAYIRE